MLRDRLDESQDEKMLIQQKLDQQQTLLLKLTARLKEAEATLRSERLASAEKLQLQQEAEARLSQQFENLANRIFEQNAGNFRELNQNSMGSPADSAQGAARGVPPPGGETHAQETAQRHNLKFELERLAELNARMTEEPRP